MLSILPDDIIIEIFKKLPVKSLLRFKVLNKTWCQIIESPMFIKYHLRHQKSVPRENQKICIVSMEHGSTLVGLDACGYDFTLGCTTEKIAELRNPERVKQCYYIGSSNGLICIGVQEYSVYTSIVERIIIWNPSTRKSNIIEATPIYSPLATRTDVLLYEWSACVYGFSYVLSIDDYRVVKIYYQWELCHPHVEVFSVKTNRWSVISVAGLAIPNDLPVMDKRNEEQLSQHAVVVNEVMYYKTIQYAKDGMQLSKIKCFDLGSGCFLKELISLPPGLKHWHSDDLRLAELGGVLCCITCKNTSIPSNGFEIWKKEGGDVWSKMISIPSWGLTTPLVPICLTSHIRWMTKTDENNGGRGGCLIVSDGTDLYEVDMSTGKREFFYRLDILKGWEEKLFLFDEETLVNPS